MDKKTLTAGGREDAVIRPAGPPQRTPSCGSPLSACGGARENADSRPGPRAREDGERGGCPYARPEEGCPQGGGMARPAGKEPAPAGAFRLADNVREDAGLRASFNALTRATYGFDFEEWHRDGHWSASYIPHVLLDGDRVAANVSVNLMSFTVCGQARRYIQLGTVMTDPAYRRRGLSRRLMETVLARYAPGSDGVFLFANDTVLDFYPKFGFRRVQEYAFEKDLPPAVRPGGEARRLDMGSAAGRQRLLAAYCRGNPHAAVTVRENPGLLFFYAAGPLRDAVWELPELDAVAIAGAGEEGTLCCDEVFCPPEVPLDDVLAALAGALGPGLRRAELGFAPEKPAGWQARELESEDTLFFLGNGEPLFEQKRLRFPALSHA